VTQAVKSHGGGLVCCSDTFHLLTAAEGPVGADAWDVVHGPRRVVPADATAQAPVAGLNPFLVVSNPLPAR